MLNNVHYLITQAKPIYLHLKLISVFHHLLSVGPKQLCAQLGCTREAGTSYLLYVPICIDSTLISKFLSTVGLKSCFQLLVTNFRTFNNVLFYKKLLSKNFFDLLTSTKSFQSNIYSYQKNFYASKGATPILSVLLF